MADDNVGEMAAHYELAQRRMVSVKSYADRGRKFAALSDDHLRAKFIAVTKAWALDLFSAALRFEQSDLIAEFGLRNQEPPYDAAADDLDKICKGAMTFLASLPQERRDEIGESIVLDYLLARQQRT